MSELIAVAIITCKDKSYANSIIAKLLEKFPGTTNDDGILEFNANREDGINEFLKPFNYSLEVYHRYPKDTSTVRTPSHSRFDRYTD